MSQGIHTRRRPILPALLAAVAAGVALLFVAPPAFAHDELIGATPAAGSQVDELPAELELTFSGVLIDEPGATEIVVTDAVGTDLTAGDPVLDGTRLTQPLQGEPQGTVTVLWRVVSSDGHPVSDEFTFTVGDGTAPVPIGTPTPAPTDQGGELTWVWIVLGIVVVGLGGALVAVLLARARAPRED